MPHTITQFIVRRWLSKTDIISFHGLPQPGTTPSQRGADVRSRAVIFHGYQVVQLLGAAESGFIERTDAGVHTGVVNDEGEPVRDGRIYAAPTPDRPDRPARFVDLYLRLFGGARLEMWQDSCS